MKRKTGKKLIMTQKDDPARIEFAKRLRHMLDKKAEEGKTPSWFAKQLGLTPSALVKWYSIENYSGAWPGSKYIPKLAELLGCSISYLLTGKDTEHPNILQIHRIVSNSLKEKIISDNIEEYGIKSEEAKILKMILQNDNYTGIIQAIQENDFQKLAELLYNIFQLQSMRIVHHLSGMINQSE